MKNQNTLRQYGGVDIKLKNKNPRLSTILYICIAGIAVLAGVHFLLDYLFSGPFIEWFEKNYIIESFTPGEGNYAVRQELLWTGIQSLTEKLIIAGIIFWGIIIYLTVHFFEKRKMKETITDTSHLIRDFMESKTENTDIFPKEYSEITAQMLKIKADMQEHERLLKEETERKNDLITYLAHDLKTPLTSVIGYLSLLNEIPDMSVEQRSKYLDILLKKSKRLEGLINEFFEITRYTLQQIQLEKEKIDLYYMLIQMSDEFYPILKAHGNTIELNADENLTVYGDPVKLARVFNNILKNAVSYSYPDTVIKIWTEEKEGVCRIYFQNQGRTIPSHKLDMIFEKFFRMDEARTSNTGGAGLGLAIAKEIVTLHGGAITADSENERTTFCVSLPV